MPDSPHPLAPPRDRWSRTRLLLAGLLVAAALAVLVSYALRRHAAPPQVAPVSLSIQRTAQGFVLSRSVRGRMLFRLQAGLATQYKDRDRVALQNVRLDLFDPDGRHVDQIYGGAFDYEPRTGLVRAQSLVHIDLEGELPAGALNAPGAPPEEIHNPVHVAARDLIFNAKSGSGDVTGGLDFQYLDASGGADRGHLETETDQITLSGHVHLSWTRAGQSPLAITAGSALLDRPLSRIVLSEQPRLVSGSRWLRAGEIVLQLRPDYSVRAARATGGIEAHEREAGRVLAAQADQALLELRPRPGRRRADPLSQANLAATALRMTGRVRIDAQAAREDEQLQAGSVVIRFGQENEPAAATASGGARLMLRRAAGAPSGRRRAPTTTAAEAALETARGGQATIAAPALAFTFAPPSRRGAPSRLARVATLGRGTAVWQAPGAPQDRITADRLALRLNADQRPQAAAADGQVLLAAAGARPGAPPRQLQANHLAASFAPNGGLQQARATGAVDLRQGDERALADRADFEPARNSVLLQAQPGSAFTHGKVSASSPDLTLSAPSVREQGGSVVAEGGVTASLLPRAAQGGSGTGAAAPFGGDGGQPIDIAAQRAAIAPKGAAGEFSGAVRLWQGANVMWADRVTFARDGPHFSAAGGVRSNFLAPRGLPEERGASFAALAGSGRAGRTRPAAPTGPMPVLATADRLDYAGVTRQAVYSGHVKVTAGDSILTAPKLSIEFLPAGAPAAPAQVRRAVAEGGAQLLEPGRRAAAEQIVYDFAAGLVTLRGGSPSIFDAELGYLAGSTLTFSPSNASIRVESGVGSRTYGEYRIKK